MAVAAKVRVFTRATSFGGTESLVEHRASVEGAATRTPDNLLRLSIGLEHPDDLIEDLDAGAVMRLECRRRIVDRHGGPMSLSERVALVTGGARGIGLAIARRLLADGARVALVDRDRSAVEGAAAGLGASARRSSPT